MVVHWGYASHFHTYPHHTLLLKLYIPFYSRYPCLFHISVCVYIYIYIHIYIHIYIYIHTYIHTHIHIHIHLHIHIHIHISTIYLCCIPRKIEPSTTCHQPHQMVMMFVVKNPHGLVALYFTMKTINQLYIYTYTFIRICTYMYVCVYIYMYKYV